MGYLVFGLLFLLLVVFAFLTARNWHWSNIVMLLFIFIFGVVASFAAAKGFEQRQKGLVEYDRSMKQVAKLTEDLATARYGSPTTPGYAPDSLYGYEHRLKLAQYGRGRVWLNGNVTTGQDGKAKFVFSTARDPADPQIGSLKNLRVFAFQDAMSGEVMYPSTFIGIYRVESENASEAVLDPEMVIDEEVASMGGSWSVYEKMPTDRADVFEDVAVVDGARLSISDFRQKLESEYLSADRLGMDPASVEYETLVDQFAFDGRSIGEIEKWVEENAANRLSGPFSPDAEEIFVRYRFNAKSTRDYPVDGQGNIVSDGAYTLLGLAIDPALHLGRNASFAPDDEVLIDLPTANGYERDQTSIPPFSQTENVTEIDRVFRRRVFNYPRMIADLRRQSSELVEKTAELTEQIEKGKLVLQEANEQERKRVEMLAKFREDNGNLTRDLEAINVVLEMRKRDVESMQQELADLRRKIDALRARRDGKPNP